MMIAERDYRFWRAGAPVERLAMIAKRDYRSTWRPGAPAEWQDRDNPYELFAVGLWCSRWGRIDHNADLARAGRPAVARLIGLACQIAAGAFLGAVGPSIPRQTRAGCSFQFGPT